MNTTEGSDVMVKGQFAHNLSADEILQKKKIFS